MWPEAVRPVPYMGPATAWQALMTEPVSDRTERVLLDAVVVATPAADPGLAVQLGPGRLDVHAKLADDDIRAPTLLLLRSDRNADPGASVEMPITGDGASATVDLAGGVYSIRLHVNADATDDGTLREMRASAQFVELRIVYAPR
jgi:hypothetical protein